MYSTTVHVVFAHMSRTQWFFIIVFHLSRTHLWICRIICSTFVFETNPFFVFETNFNTAEMFHISMSRTHLVFGFIILRIFTSVLWYMYISTKLCLFCIHNILFYGTLLLLTLRNSYSSNIFTRNRSLEVWQFIACLNSAPKIYQIILTNCTYNNRIVNTFLLTISAISFHLTTASKNSINMFFLLLIVTK